MFVPTSTVRQIVAIASLLVTVTFGAGCNPRPANATPEGAVREFIERMRVVNGDAAAAKIAFTLLSKKTRQNLAERAQRYSAASGKTIAPEAMIVPSRFVVRFEPQRMSTTLAGTHALVELAGLSPDERAKVACIFEDEAWRVELPLPPLAPVQVRPGN